MTPWPLHLQVPHCVQPGASCKSCKQKGAECDRLHVELSKNIRAYFLREIYNCGFLTGLRARKACSLYQYFYYQSKRSVLATYAAFDTAESFSQKILSLVHCTKVRFCDKNQSFDFSLVCNSVFVECDLRPAGSLLLTPASDLQSVGLWVLH